MKLISVLLLAELESNGSGTLFHVSARSLLVFSLLISNVVFHLDCCRGLKHDDKFSGIKENDYRCNAMKDCVKECYKNKPIDFPYYEDSFSKKMNSYKNRYFTVGYDCENNCNKKNEEYILKCN